MVAIPESPYRALQRRAKAAGLSAKGTAKALEEKLEEHEAGVEGTQHIPLRAAAPRHTTGASGDDVDGTHGHVRVSAQQPPL
jgi:hypothetical protein